MDQYDARRVRDEQRRERPTDEQRRRDLARAGIERARARQDAKREQAMSTPIDPTNKVQHAR